LIFNIKIIKKKKRTVNSIKDAIPVLIDDIFN